MQTQTALPFVAPLPSPKEALTPAPDDALEPGALPAIDYPINGTLWAHQRRALLRASTRAAFAFHHDPGLGKTLTVLAEAGRMFLDGEIDTLVIIAPNRVHQQWIEKQAPRWLTVPYRGWFLPKGGMKSQTRKAAFEHVIAPTNAVPKLRIFAFNFEAVRIKGRTPEHRMPDNIRALDRIFDTSKRGVYLAVDEAHRCKDGAAQQTRGVMRYGRGRAKVRRSLTGTPLLQGVQDLWSIYAFLDWRIIGERTFPGFRSLYCKTEPVPSHPRAVRIVGARNEAALMRRIEPFTSRVLDTQVLDMPKRLFVPFEVDMEPAQARAFAEMDTLMMTMLRTGEHAGEVVTAPIVLTQLLRLLQIGSGYLQDGDQVHWLSDVKIEVIRDRVEDLGGEPVVVWAPWIPLLDRLTDALGAVRFREMSDLKVWEKKGGPLVANPASGGVGVDGMQIAHRAIYAANLFHLEHRIQSIKRIHRGDQKLPCFYTDVIAKGSRDQFVIDALAAKRDLGRLTVDTLRDLLL